MINKFFYASVGFLLAMTMAGWPYISYANKLVNCLVLFFMAGIIAHDIINHFRKSV